VCLRQKLLFSIFYFVSTFFLSTFLRSTSKYVIVIVSSAHHNVLLILLFIMANHSHQYCAYHSSSICYLVLTLICFIIEIPLEVMKLFKNSLKISVPMKHFSDYRLLPESKKLQMQL
jgi:hypothetical protein